MSRPEHIPAPQSDVAAALFEALTPFIEGRHLSFGGGTVLAARWKHRQSFDVDLFCEPTVYGRLTLRERTRIERAIRQIGDCSQERTWCEDIATYTEIGQIEATVLPRSVSIEAGAPTRLAGTDLALQCNAQILYAKIARRMYQAGEIAVRDAYDLAASAIHDPAALAQACEHTSPRVLESVRAIVDALPDGWSANDTKALIEPQHQWSEGELREGLLAALRTDPSQHAEEAVGQ